ESRRRDPAAMMDLNERFPALKTAPIVEAMIDVRARASTEWNADGLRDHLEARLPDYPDVQSRRLVRLRATLEAEGEGSHSRDDMWRGLRATSGDKLQVAQFNRDGFAFSRLAPYQNWDQ